MWHCMSVMHQQLCHQQVSVHHILCMLIQSHTTTGIIHVVWVGLHWCNRVKLRMHICNAAAEQQRQMVCSSACNKWPVWIHAWGSFSIFLPFLSLFWEEKSWCQISQKWLRLYMPYRGKNREDPKESPAFGCTKQRFEHGAYHNLIQQLQLEFSFS